MVFSALVSLEISPILFWKASGSASYAARIAEILS